MSDLIKKLPPVFQTATEKKFFDATFDQVFSKKSSEYLAGYLGRRVPGRFDPIGDFYIPEQSKNRTWWQLEPAVFSRDKDYEKTNVFFYEDLLDKIKFHGGSTTNQDRLFSSDYYSWAPPIDIDMFVNYHNYYWVDQGLPPIQLTNITAADIIGQWSYTTHGHTAPKDLKLSTGMVITFRDDPSHTSEYTVEFGDSGIQLVTKSSSLIAGSTYEFLPWDSAIARSDGRTIDGTRWDTNTWEVQLRSGGYTNVDYITIRRGAIDKNAWSRTNRWVHLDTIRTVCDTSGLPFPSNALRALRPIIQFIPDIYLYKSGERFRSNIAFGLRGDNNSTLITLETVQTRSIDFIRNVMDIDIQDGDLVTFFDDESEFVISNTPWDTDGGTLKWDTTMWDDGPTSVVNKYIFKTHFTDDGRAVFLPHTGWDTPVMDGDIVFVEKNGPGLMGDQMRSAKANESWYYSGGKWQQIFNEKYKANQPPVFTLFDHDGVELDDSAKYPHSTFAGSEIFSYKTSPDPSATLDPVLGMPILFRSMGQSSDIVFQNELITERHEFGESKSHIDGYYYFKTLTEGVLRNGWEIYSPNQSYDAADRTPTPSKQRVIDRYVVGYGSEYSFQLSVKPHGYPLDSDIVVSVDGVEVPYHTVAAHGYGFTTINNRIYVDLSAYLTTKFKSNRTIAPVVEITTYSTEPLSDSANGYFQIPQQLEANPSQLEVADITASELSAHFVSIIENQLGFDGVAFGGSNNYRDSLKNLSVGGFILQNVAPALKAMLVSSDSDLDLINAIRFSQEEYTKFKNRYVSTAQRLIDQGFSPIEYHNNSIKINQWVDEILKVINISKEFSTAFSYSYMVASGTAYSTETAVVTSSSMVLSNYLDITRDQNSMYVYDVTGGETLLVRGVDYEVVSDSLLIEVIILNSGLMGKRLSFVLYENPKPAYLPSTPSKLGLHATHVPRMEMDTTYAIPALVIVGHDGSRTIAYGDYRDRLLLELELRIYNLIQTKFRTEYSPPVRIESIRPGYFRSTGYTVSEYADVIEPYLNKWCARNRANYRINEWTRLSTGVAPNQLWKLYNYRYAVTTSGTRLNMPGNWRGIFQHLYDTQRPDTCPWEMLGFSEQPTWWIKHYGSGILNTNGQMVWTSRHAAMWSDLEAGIIREGNTAVVDRTHAPVPVKHWARPGLSTLVPVDTRGEIVPIPRLLGLKMTSDPYHPYDDFDADWQHCDISPVEYAWTVTSAYAFTEQELLYLTKPAVYGEMAWDTLGTEFSPGKTAHGLINSGYQYVQNGIYESEDPFFKWTRPKNRLQTVHGEFTDGQVNVRYGYQRWISDSILFLSKDVTETFGVKIRNLDVNLANKVGGFTNKSSVNLYMESVGIGTSTSAMGVPSNNFQVLLHRGPPVFRQAYSGVIIKSMGDGTFAIYGYDLLDSSFTVLDRTTDRLIDVTVGGTPAEYRYFAPGDTYRSGDIVRYNGAYYSSIGEHSPNRFQQSAWAKLTGLPTVGGISVTYKPVSASTRTTYPYGSILKSPQEVFDFLIGWGAYLESMGWDFTTVDSESNVINDWLTSAKQYLFWLNSDWEADSAIQLSPLANQASVRVSRGYPNDVEMISNGVYSILDKRGIAIPTTSTITERVDQRITVSPTDLKTGGIYFLQVTASETEHVIVIDNTTSFNDSVYSPLLRARQDRIRFNGFRSKEWYGKMEAPGYLIVDDTLVPNFDTIVNDIRYYYDPNVALDDGNTEDLGMRLIGHESKAYMDNLQISNDIQYLFYKGMIRQKGTAQTLDRLFRSIKTRSNGLATVYEEWALKAMEFGNTVGRVSTEFILDPELDTGDVTIANLNFVPTPRGGVSAILLANATRRYTTAPKIIVGAPDAVAVVVHNFHKSDVYFPGDVVNTTLNGITGQYECRRKTGPGAMVSDDWARIRPALAYSILDKQGKISRIDMIDSGYGYESAPTVSILDSGTAVTDDIAFAVWQGDVVSDITLDNVVNIDIDDPARWVYRPSEPEHSAKFPTVDQIWYDLPNAGYVNFADVDWYSLNVETSVVNWGSDGFNPVEGETVWVAKTFTGDWDVFKLASLPLVWSITDDTQDGSLLILVDENVTMGTQFSGNTYSTDFGNLIVLQQVSDDGSVPYATNYTLAISTDATTYTDPDGVKFTAYGIVTLDGVPVQAVDIEDFKQLNRLLAFKSLRYPHVPSVNRIPMHLGLGDLIWVDDMDGKWAVLSISAEPGIWDSAAWDLRVVEYWGQGADQSGDDFFGWDTRGPITLVPHRIQEPMLNTALFDNAQIFPSPTGETVASIPVFDPFKGILPGAVSQNITYMTDLDPARYNVTAVDRLRSDNVIFDEVQVGQLWWDTSTALYLYYEQPMARDGSESVSDNLKYRRDNWGQMFPGSVVDIYEWTESAVPPDQWEGTGEPRDLVNYTAVTKSDHFTNVLTTRYYFWVKDSTTKPNRPNRTLTARDVATFITSPKTQGYSFYTPIQQTATSNAYMFYNVQEILAYRGNYIRVDYRHNKDTLKPHVQWSLFRENDRESKVPVNYWDRMVDSICGFTGAVTTPGDTRAIEVRGQLVYPVPDPTLSDIERMGIEVRPRQTMFKNMHMARQILVSALNELLANIAVRDTHSSWALDFGTTGNQYWAYETWFKSGYSDVKPDVLFHTLTEAYKSLIDGHLVAGDVIQVINGTIDGRAILYEVQDQLGSFVLEEVAIHQSTVRLSDAVFTNTNDYSLALELRKLLTAFKAYVFVDDNEVYQNRLFSSMLNYVLSEQRTPDWVFKTSYITIKEDSANLVAEPTFSPSQIDNIIDYIVDVKPYHVQIRDYVSSYSLFDLAHGTTDDILRSKITLTFNPGPGIFDPDGWDTFMWDEYGWEMVHDEIVDRRILVDANTYSVGDCEPRLVYDWDWDRADQGWDSIEWDKDPVAVYCTPTFGTSVPAAQWEGNNMWWDIFAWDREADGVVIHADINQTISKEIHYQATTTGLDVSKRGLSELFPYTFSFDSINMNGPQTFTTPKQIISITCGSKTLILGRDYHTGYNSDDNTYTAYLFNDPGAETLVANALVTGGDISRVTFETCRREYALGFPTDGCVVLVDTKQPLVEIDPGEPWDVQAWDRQPWDVEPTVVVLGVTDNTTSFRVTVDSPDAHYMRNSADHECRLASDVNPPDWGTVWLDSILVECASDLLPDPSTRVRVIWIGGECIEYRIKESVGAGLWRLRQIRRGVRGTSAQAHTVGSPVFIEAGNVMPDDSHVQVWNSAHLVAAPDMTSGYDDKYTSINNASLGGMWYAKTAQAAFLIDHPGQAIK